MLNVPEILRLDDPYVRHKHKHKRIGVRAVGGGGGAMGSTAHPQIFGISHYLGNKSPIIRAKRITKLGKINENNNNFF